MPPPQPLGRSTMPSLGGSGRQNLDSTSSKSSSRSFAILKRYVFPGARRASAGWFPGQRGDPPSAPEPAHALVFPRRPRRREASGANALERKDAVGPRLLVALGYPRGQGSELSLAAWPRDGLLSVPDWRVLAYLPLLGPGCNHSHTTP